MTTTTIPTLFSLCAAAIDPSSIKDENIKIGILDRTDFWLENQKSSECKKSTNAAIYTTHHKFFGKSKFEAFAWDTILDAGSPTYFYIGHWLENYNSVNSIYVAICDYFGIPLSHANKSRELMEAHVQIYDLPIDHLRHEYIQSVLFYRMGVDSSQGVVDARLSYREYEEDEIAEREYLRERIRNEMYENGQMAVCFGVVESYDPENPEDIVNEYWVNRGYHTAEAIIRYAADVFGCDYDVVAEDVGGSCSGVDDLLYRDMGHIVNWGAFDYGAQYESAGVYW